MNTKRYGLAGWVFRWWKQDRPPVRRRFAPLGVEQLEPRVVPSDFRSITGFDNNLANPTWGQAGTDLLRVSPVAYADGISAPSTPNTLSPRTISNDLNNQSDPIFSGADNLGAPPIEGPVRLRLRLGPVHRPRHGPHPDQLGHTV